MSSGIRSDASGTFGALTFGGDDAITFDATGIQAGSYKAGSIVDTDLTLSANSAPVKVALNAAGNAPIFACRAWVNFNGTGTVAIRASGNVSSITDNGAGDYTVNFTNPMPDANYAVSGFVNAFSNATLDLAGLVTAYSTLYPPTDSAFRFTTAVSYDCDVSDFSRISIAVFR